MVRDEGFEPPIADSESAALPLGESRVETEDIVVKNKKETKYFVSFNSM